MSFLLNNIAMANYIGLANSSEYNMLQINQQRLNMISSPEFLSGSMSMKELANLDAQMEINALTAGVQRQIANAMIEQIKKFQEDNIKRSFSTFA
jgi:N-acetylmuramic acid 6-phosphate (MurNAc-6-P) etherase